MSRDVSTFGGGDATFVPEGEEAPAAADWLVGRYEVGALLGRGGSGQVHAARDHLTGDDVAVKLVSRRGSSAARQVRRELTALRLLDLPGVVGLRDDGELPGDQIFIVMDLLPGGRFDQLAPGGWEAWAPAARTLLESLARVHFAGVLHRDLKPGNILLDADARPVITDFGLARGHAVEHGGSLHREGTPRYMAPEQAQGRPCDERTDLYALGVMFEEMLEGQPAPPEVRAVVAAMRAKRTADRPASVVEVLHALGVGTDALLGTAEALPEVATEAELRALFQEPPRSFLHIAEDAAQILFDRTGGVREAVAAELERWVRAGHCHWAEGQVVMERAALDRLAWEGDPELQALVARSREAPESEVAAALVERASELHRSGRAARAFGLLDAALPLLTEPAPTREVLELYVPVALSLAREDDVREAMYRCERAGAQDLLGLLQGALLSWGGDRERAIDLLSVPVSAEGPEPELGRFAHLVQACAAAAPDRLDAVLEAAASLRQVSPVAEGRWHVWKGQAHYARWEFEAALASNERARDLLHDAPVLQLAALSNAGQAALEAGRNRRALLLSVEAGRVAASLRHAVAECRAVILQRHAAYRARHPQTPVPELVDAAAQVSRRLGLELAVYEALIAQGTRHAATLALRAVELVREGDGLVGTVARAMAHIFADGAVPPPADVEALPAALRLQIEALWAQRPDHRPPCREDVEAWSSSWPASPDARLDIMSLRDCLVALGFEDQISKR